MTPAARVQTAIELLDDILAGLPAEQALTSWARRSRFAGSKDRAAIRDHVYDALRRRRSALPNGLRESGRALMLGLLSQDKVDVAGLFADLPYGPPAMTTAEAEAIAGDFGDAIDLPGWIIPRLQSVLGSDFQTNVQALRHRAPVFLRVNLRKTDLRNALTRLAEEGITCRASEIADTALEVTEGARKIAQTSAYRDGLVELQDASSQAAIASLPLSDGLRVLDYCAGGGGKTLAMAGRMQGTFVAHDANPSRLRDVPNRAARAGVGVVIADREQLKREYPFDLVFCDVPCSGSGTWRRSPDAKWRLTEDGLAGVCALQAEIVDQAKDYVKTGGSLVYATCSMLQEENQDQITRFLEANPGFGCQAMRNWSMADGCDGFFLALLTRHS